MDEWARWAARPDVVERLAYWENARLSRRAAPEFDVSQLSRGSVCIWVERGDGPFPLIDITQHFVVLRDWADALAYLLAYEVPDSLDGRRGSIDDSRSHWATWGTPGGRPADRSAELIAGLWEALADGGENEELRESVRCQFGRMFSDREASRRIVAWGKVDEIFRTPELYQRLRAAVSADEAEGDWWSPCAGLKFCADYAWFEESVWMEGAMDFLSREACSG